MFFTYISSNRVTTTAASAGAIITPITPKSLAAIIKENITTSGCKSMYFENKYGFAQLFCINCAIISKKTEMQAIINPFWNPDKNINKPLMIGPITGIKSEIAAIKPNNMAYLTCNIAKPIATMIPIITIDKSWAVTYPPTFVSKLSMTSDALSFMLSGNSLRENSLISVLSSFIKNIIIPIVTRIVITPKNPIVALIDFWIILLVICALGTNVELKSIISPIF